MTDEELIARLRKADEYEPLGHDGWEAADRIEALVREQNYWIERCGRERAFASSHRVRAERLEAALKWQAEQPEAHPFMVAQARAALKGADHE